MRCHTRLCVHWRLPCSCQGCGGLIRLHHPSHTHALYAQPMPCLARWLWAASHFNCIVRSTALYAGCQCGVCLLLSCSSAIALQVVARQRLYWMVLSAAVLCGVASRQLPPRVIYRATATARYSCDCCLLDAFHLVGSPTAPELFAWAQWTCAVCVCGHSIDNDKATAAEKDPSLVLRSQRLRGLEAGELVW